MEWEGTVTKDHRPFSRAGARPGPRRMSALRVNKTSFKLMPSCPVTNWADAPTTDMLTKEAILGVR